MPTENEVLSKFLTAVRNEWLEQNGYDYRVTVTVTDLDEEEPPE